ncbi:MAG TPA: PHP domain-containing protein [Terriglobia bacterium]|nr:PHP domain-containing protein [Terriglobia bacterium]
MQSFVDLHVHSFYSSDADCAPRRLFELAKQTGLSAFSISDHDTVGALEEGEGLSREFGIELIPSVEFSTRYQSRSYHVLAPFVDPRNLQLHELLENQLLARIRQAKGRIERLRDLGFDVSFEEVTERNGNSVPVGPSLAEALLSKASNQKDSRLEPYLTGNKSEGRAVRFYRDYFEEGRPAYVEAEEVGTLEAFKAIKEAGGIPVLAHPGAPAFQVDEVTLEAFVSEGLDGLEVYSSYHDSVETSKFSEWAGRYRLVITAGSDFHGKVKPRVRFGSIRNRGREMLDELLARREAYLGGR